MKKIISSLAIIAAAGAIATSGTFALFSDVESSNGNTFTAGTLDLAINGNNPATGTLINVTSGQGFAPGQTGSVSLALGNWGSISGSLSFMVSNLSSEENSLLEPEADTEANGAQNNDGQDGDSTIGTGNGELQDQLLVWVMEGSTVVAPSQSLSSLTTPVTLMGGLANGQTRNLDFVYMYQNAVTNNWSMSDSVSFSLDFALKQ